MASSLKKPAARTPSSGPAHVALLRGINVGGKNKLPMRDLAEMFVEIGCTDVRTYIQSGNVVFGAKPAIAKRVPALVSAAIDRGFGLSVPVIIRTAAELGGAAAGNPFLASGADAGGEGEGTAALHVGFLADSPDPRRVGALDPRRSPGDSFRVLGREVYLHLPNGVARSKLTNSYFDGALGTTSTFRNWRTILRLVEMARTPE